jgi:hypothetical protein
MSEPVRSRRIIALTAAYVVALQALLLPLSVAAGSALAGSVCASSAGQTQAPAGDDTGCPCAAGCGMQCFAQVLPASPQASTAVTRTLAHMMAAAPQLAPAERVDFRHPQNPRAPPAA